MRVFLAHPGARNHYEVARALESQGMLASFLTDFYRLPPAPVSRLGSMSRLPSQFAWLKAYSERSAGLPAEHVSVSRRMQFASILRKFTRSPQSIALADRLVAKAMTIAAVSRKFSNAQVVYGYSGSAAYMFKAGKAAGKTLILDQASATIKTANAIMEQASQDWPAWPFERVPGAYQEMEEIEYELADKILSPSSFVRHSLVSSGVDDGKIFHNPYSISAPFDGTPMNLEPGDVRNNRPLNLLFVGRFCLQKGAPYLLEALKRIDSRHMNLTVIGSTSGVEKLIEGHQSRVSFRGHLPRSEVRRAYSEADFLCLPSVCEGFGMVQLEALQTGVPVIASTHCGDVAEHGLSGYRVPAMSSDAIAETLENIMAARDSITAMRRAALKRAQEFSFEAFARRLHFVVAGGQ